MADAQQVDCFSLLGVPRQPWVPAEAVESRFLELSATCHPDRFSTAPAEQARAAHDTFVALNNARQVLSDPKSRLLHLLELETGRKPSDIQRLPAGGMEIFMKVGQLCRDIDAFLAAQATVTSPMLKVARMSEALRRMREVQDLEAQVVAQQTQLFDELARLNAAWDQAPATASPSERVAALPLQRLEEIYRSLGYLGRWIGQLRERSIRLVPQ